MKFTIVTLVSSFAALSAAQSLSDLPTCAQTCVGNSLSSTGCQTFNFTCICKSSGWIAGLSCCISKACDAADQAATIKFASQLCAIDGVTLPQSAGCASGVSATGASTASGTLSTTTSGVTSTTVTATVTGSTTTGTVTGVVVSTISKPTGSTASSASASGSSTGTASVAGTTSSAAAPHMAGSGMGAIGAAIAALAFL